MWSRKFEENYLRLRGVRSFHSWCGRKNGLKFKNTRLIWTQNHLTLWHTQNSCMLKFSNPIFHFIRFECFSNESFFYDTNPLKISSAVFNQNHRSFIATCGFSTRSRNFHCYCCFNWRKMRLLFCDEADFIIRVLSYWIFQSLINTQSCQTTAWKFYSIGAFPSKINQNCFKMPYN